MKTRNLLLSFACFFASQAFSQLSGVYTVPGTYTSVAAAVDALNLQGVNGAVTININAGYTETVPLGGLTLTTTGTAANPITFQKSGSGANPILSAFAGGVATPASAVQDGIWSLVGCDYITISGIDLSDLNTANPATMEYGYGLFKTSATNGCQNVTIRNCTVTLNRINNAAGSGVSFDGSRAINVVNALITSQTSSVNVSSASGANSNNRFYSNLLQNCNTGIALSGFDDLSPFSNSDSGNDVGGVSLSTGNNILNFGGGGTNPSMAVRTRAQQSLNVSYNTVNNNNGSGVSHTGMLKGIFVDVSPASNVTINNNILTLKFGGTSATVACIENLSGSGGTTNTVQINSNQLTQCTNTNATSGPWYGIHNNGASPAVLKMNSNTSSGNTTAAPGSPVYLILNSGSVTTLMEAASNNLSFSYNGAFSNTGTFYGVTNSVTASGASVSISQNTLSGTMFPVTTGSGSVIFISNEGSCQTVSILSNRFSNLTVNNNGTHVLISCYGFIQSSYNISNNSITGNYVRSGTSGSMRLIACSNSMMGAASSGTISSNVFSNIANTSGLTSGSFTGISCNSISYQQGTYPRKTISNNVISNVSYSASILATHFAYTFNGMGDGGSGQPSVISNNVVSNFTTASSFLGFWLLPMTGPTLPTIVSNNTIAAIRTGTGNSTGQGQYIRGIYVDGGPGGILIEGTRIYGLTAGDVQSQVFGMLIQGMTTMTITNSWIGNLYTPGANGHGVYGIRSTASSGTLNLFHNSIYLDASSNSGNFRATNLVTTSFEYLRMKNNIFVNNSSPSGFGGQLAVSREYGSMVTYDPGNNNNIFYGGSCSTCRPMGNGSANYNNIIALKSALFPAESNSHEENVPFASTQGANPLFLHLNVNAFSQANNGGLAIPNYSVDIDNEIRQGYPGYLGNGTAPDIGADEYDSNVSNCSSGVSPYVGPSSFTFCPGSPITLGSNISSLQNGLQFQWKIGTAASGPFTNAVNGAGATNTTYIGAPMPPGTYYFVLTNTCSANSSTSTSNTNSFQVIAGPQYTLSASASTLCGGSSLSLSAIGSGAVFFNWYGPQLFMANTLSASIATVHPGHSGTYSLQAGSAQCTFNGTIAVRVYPSVTSVSSSPASATICTGSTAGISAGGGLVTSGYSVGTGTNSYTYSVNLSPYSRIYSGQRRQMIVAASELITTGIAPNSTINSIQFPVNSFGQYWTLPGFITFGNTDFAVRIGTTTLSSFSLNTPFQTGLTSVFYASNFRPGIGYDNYHNFSTPFFWDGVSNVIIETTFGNGSYLNSPDQAAVYQNYTNTPDTMSIVYQNDNYTSAQMAVSSSPNTWYMARPNFKFSVLQPGAYSWAPPAALSSSSGVSVVATPVSSTNYTLSVTDNTCSATAQTQIQVVQPPTVTASASPTVGCAGQLFVLTSSGASGYQWIGGPNSATYFTTPSTSGVYTVSGTNAPCPPASATVQVVVNPLPSLSIQTGSTTICKGQTTTLSAIGSGTFLWNTGSNNAVISVSPSLSASYVVTLTNVQLCQSIASAFINVNQLPVITLNQSSITICAGEEYTFFAIGATQYSWAPMGTSGNSITLTNSQQFTVTGTNANGCQNTSMGELIADPCTGIKTNREKNQMGVRPNPSAGIFTLYLQLPVEKNRIIKVRDVSGKIVYEKEAAEDEVEIDIRTLANGMYYAELLEGIRLTGTWKLVKQ